MWKYKLILLQISKNCKVWNFYYIKIYYALKEKILYIYLKIYIHIKINIFNENMLFNFVSRIIRKFNLFVVLVKKNKKCLIN